MSQWHIMMEQLVVLCANNLQIEGCRRWEQAVDLQGPAEEPSEHTIGSLQYRMQDRRVDSNPGSFWTCAP